ncbi:methyl-accepting chemotaxis protein [Marinimicrobium alkaliphilum]|uniref:methyl-accepting chemotaxis protein n=1 Tax=Marinimicrobium alkaliphilum TaxID=2202654 RepID=UPI000DBA8C04|nr:PAS domain-containing methyl-accepting chemotaxis protein [Marinimicrobium alkaliphilum]
MRVNSPVTQRNVPVSHTANILSTTDAKGQITYINEEFVHISGFDADELVGQHHNIIRHPDMPRAAFKEMWQRLKSGRSWLGAVKNRCKNGDHYWVQAYAIPVMDEQGQIKEFQSVRSQLTPEAQARAEALYTGLQKNEPRNGEPPAYKLARSPSLRVQLCLLLIVALGAQALALISTQSLLAQLLASAAIGALALAALCLQINPLMRLVKQARSVVNDTLAEKIFTGRTDDIGSLDLALTQQRAELDAVVKRIDDILHSLNRGAELTMGHGQQAHDAVHKQSEQTGSIATASQQTSSSAETVSGNAEQMLHRVKHAHEQISAGKKFTTDTNNSMDQLTAELDSAADNVSRLADAGKQVNVALQVISDITDQTNLLALNASIEAARAGEAGRGFAVVADEVRQLALRTAESTKTIEALVSNFDKSIVSATQSMERCGEHSKVTQENATESAQMLGEILAFIEEIRHLCDNTAAAASQQRDSSSEINNRIASIHGLGENAKARVQEAQHALSELRTHIGGVGGLVKRLRERNQSRRGQATH